MMLAALKCESIIMPGNGRPHGSTTESRHTRRTGHHVQQAGGYRAFIPKPLPPEPPVTMDEELWRLLSDADRALGRLDGVTRTLPDINLFLTMYVRKEALYSSQIEGTQASLDDILAHERKIAGAENPDDVEEVVNYVAAINLGLERLREMPLSLRLIREIHARLMQGVRGKDRTPGEFRRSQNWIGGRNTALAEAVFVPPPAHALMEHLGQLEKFMHTDSSLPVLVQIGLIHAQFETIHPFLDGNGRLGRLLITFLLCEREILSLPALYLSHYFKRYRSEYYQRLQDVRDKGDWEGWLKFFLRGVRETAQEGARTAARIVEQREAHRRLIGEKMSHARAGSAYKLMDNLHQRPVISIAGAAEIIEQTYATARGLVMDLVSLGLLEEITGRGRDRLYRYAPYINLFREQE
jgi:Fic family protein